MKRPLTLTLVSILFGWSAPAWAQPRPPGQWIVGAERLFGYSYAKETWTDETNNEIESTSSGFSLLTNSVIAGSSFAPAIYSAPRVAVDYLPIAGLTVGGTLGFAHVSMDQTLGAGDSAKSSGSLFTLVPRAGYAHMFSPTLGIWPRAGFTYFSASLETDDGDTKTSASGASFGLDALLLLMPADNVAFTVGPSLDYGLTGTVEVDINAVGRSEADLDVIQFGLQAGVSVLL